ncbi:hypothetical protein CTI14_64250, partial [Methylobacterium radiotolerans]
APHADPSAVEGEGLACVRGRLQVTVAATTLAGLSTPRRRWPLRHPHLEQVQADLLTDLLLTPIRAPSRARASPACAGACR